MKKKCVYFMKWFLPMLFMAYLGLIISFTHVHIENGITIVHSHPFKKHADGTSHQHTSVEFQLLHQLSTLLTEEAANSTHASAWLVVTGILVCQLLCGFVFRPVRESHLLRAPPANC